MVVSCITGIGILLFGRQSHFEAWPDGYNYILHFAAGLTLAFFFFGFLICIKNSWYGHPRLRLAVFFFVMCIGVGWEILEYFSTGQGMLWMTIGNTLDTILDLICDGVGGVVGLRLIKAWQKR